MSKRTPSRKPPSQTPLPAYLSKKPDKNRPVPPPTRTRAQSLPFSDLIWENFERLCKALVETDSEIKACNLYGRLGHCQNGIDLIAIPKDLTDNKPRVYQCKRVEKYTAAQIKGAVKKFTDNIPMLNPHAQKKMEDDSIKICVVLSLLASIPRLPGRNSPPKKSACKGRCFL